MHVVFSSYCNWYRERKEEADWFFDSTLHTPVVVVACRSVSFPVFVFRYVLGQLSTQRQLLPLLLTIVRRSWDFLRLLRTVYCLQLRAGRKKGRWWGDEMVWDDKNWGEMIWVRETGGERRRQINCCYFYWTEQTVTACKMLRQAKLNPQNNLEEGNKRKRSAQTQT